MTWMPWLLRAISISIVAWMLWGEPLGSDQQLPSRMVLLLDDSQSMSVADESEGATRFSAAVKKLQAVIEENSARSSNYILCTTSGLGPWTGSADELSQRLAMLQPTAEESPLGEAIVRATHIPADGRIAEIVLITDGNVTTGRELSVATEELHTWGIPLLIIGAGKEEPEFDLQLADVQAPRRIFAGDELLVRARIRLTGDQTQCNLRLFREGKDDPIAETNLTLHSNKTYETELRWRPDQPGEYALNLQLFSDEDAPVDHDLENNRRRLSVSVRPYDLKILLAWGRPQYEYRYLKALLEREARQASGKTNASPDQLLSVFLQEADREYATTDQFAIPAFPATAAALSSFDLIILGDFDPRPLTPETRTSLPQFVQQQGKGLMFVASNRQGREIWQQEGWADLLPFRQLPTYSAGLSDRNAVYELPWEVRPTPFGQTQKCLPFSVEIDNTSLGWQDLPAIYWLEPTVSLKPGAAVWVEGFDSGDASRMPTPLLVSQNVGVGQVLYQATDETHRWRYRLGDAWFGHYWRQLVRQLGRRKLLQGSSGRELTTDRQQYQAGEPVEFRVQMLGEELLSSAERESLSIEISQNAQPAQIVELVPDPWEMGQFRGSQSFAIPGTFHWKLAGTSEESLASFSVENRSLERTHIDLQSATLRKAANGTGGSYFPLSEGLAAIRDRLPLTENQTVRSGEWMHWNSPWLAAVVIGLLSGEWWLRRRRGAA